MPVKKSKIVIDALCFLAGAVVYSISVNVFLSPSGISPGGFTGAATIINHLTAIPTGTILFLLNIPVLLLGYYRLGGMFIIKTMVAIVFFSFALNVSSNFSPEFKTDKILAAIFGGVLMGIGLSLILLRGATTGGTDIIAKLINKKYRHVGIGKIILISDGVVVILNAIVYKNGEIALYSVLSMYIATHVMDILLYGADKGKVIYIISSHADKICADINNKAGRGVTKIAIIGGYTNQEKVMLMCTVRVHEVAAIYDIVNKYDNNAFVVIGDVGEIMGEGFRKN